MILSALSSRIVFVGAILCILLVVVSGRIEKQAVKLLHHFVLYGAERCVDHAWDRQRKVCCDQRGCGTLVYFCLQ